MSQPLTDGAPATQRVCLVIPTIGRPSLLALLDSIVSSTGDVPRRVVVVDDRPGAPAIPVIDIAAVTGWLRDRLVVVRSGGRGPAAARNAGWRAGSPDCDWVIFVDDDVLVGRDWLTALASDLAVSHHVGGVQGHLTVPLPSHRRPTDWERGTAGLATARWITADMAYRRPALVAVEGFDERFPRAFREDADLALRMLDADYRLSQGSRRATHPVRPASWLASLRQQRGNADDPLMRRLHGPSWAERAAAPAGRRRRHAAITAAALTGLIGALSRRRGAAVAGAAAWAVGTAEFGYARIAPGPRSRDEVLRMAVTSVLIPPAAVGHWLAGVWRWRSAERWSGAFGGPPVACSAVLFDRDGTLVKDVPYNGDPALVEPMADAGSALSKLHAAGVPIALVSNQSGIGRGLISFDQVHAVNRRVNELLGPFAAMRFCPHVAADGCECRKPAGGLIRDAAAQLGVPPEQCLVIGDIGSDVDAARAAHASSILVPTARTLAAEVAAAPVVCASLRAAVDYALAGMTGLASAPVSAPVSATAAPSGAR